jgi:hypothetical protein
VSTGKGARATASAIARLSKAARSVRAPPPLELAQGEGRVHLAHAELQPPAGGEEVEVAAAAHLDAIGQALPRGSEQARHPLVVGLPDHRLELAQDLVAGALLDQLEVEVAARARPGALHLSHHPDRGEGLAHHVPHLGAQLGDRVGGLEEREGEVQAALASRRESFRAVSDQP